MKSSLKARGAKGARQLKRPKSRGRSATPQQRSRETPRTPKERPPLAVPIGEKTEGELRLEIRTAQREIMKRIDAKMVAAAKATPGLSGAAVYEQSMSTGRAIDASVQAKANLEALLRAAAAAVDQAEVRRSQTFLETALERTSETAAWFKPSEDDAPPSDGPPSDDGFPGAAPPAAGVIYEATRKAIDRARGALLSAAGKARDDVANQTTTKNLKALRPSGNRMSAGVCATAFENASICQLACQNYIEKRTS